MGPTIRMEASNCHQVWSNGQTCMKNGMVILCITHVALPKVNKECWWEWEETGHVGCRGAQNNIKTHSKVLCEDSKYFVHNILVKSSWWYLLLHCLWGKMLQAIYMPLLKERIVIMWYMIIGKEEKWDEYWDSKEGKKTKRICLKKTLRRDSTSIPGCGQQRFHEWVSVKNSSLRTCICWVTEQN